MNWFGLQAYRCGHGANERCNRTNRRSAKIACLAISLALLPAALGFADTHPVRAQLTLPKPTLQFAAPVAPPHSAAPPQTTSFAPTTSTLSITATPRVAPLLPTATPTPNSVAQPPPEKDTALAYRVQGVLSLESRHKGVTLATTDRSFEVIVVPRASNERSRSNRRIRLLPAFGATDFAGITVYELENAVITVAEPDTWSIHHPDWQAPIARALAPVLEMATVAYDVCALDAASAGGGQNYGRGGCSLVDVPEVADYLTEHMPGLRVETSTLIADLDRIERQTQVYGLTADLAPVGDAETSYRLEWTYALSPVEEAATLADQALAWYGVVPNSDELALPAFAGGNLPAPERIVQMESSGNVAGILFALPRIETTAGVRNTLRSGGWRMLGVGDSFVATRDEKQIVVLINGAADDATTAVDLVELR